MALRIAIVLKSRSAETNKQTLGSCHDHGGD
jgi:hypothetical protein